MKKLKIAFFVPTFPSISETFIVNQIVDLKKRGYGIQIFAINGNEEISIHPEIIDNNLLDIVTYQSFSSSSKLDRYLSFFNFLVRSRDNIDFMKLLRILDYQKLGKKALNLSFYTRYQWILENGDFDIIHAHFGHSGTYIAEMKYFGYLKKTKLVTTFHGYDIHPARLEHYRSIYQKLFAYSNLITCNTLYTASLIDKLGFDRNVFILPVGLDTSKFRPNSINKRSSKFRIVFVGRLVKFKGADKAIKILEILLKRGDVEAELVIIGEGPLRQEIEKLIRELRLEENIILTGAIDSEEIKKQLEQADVFLLPGIYDETGRAETQGLVIQEAQAMKLPVVVSDAGGMQYGLVDGKTGFVVGVDDLDGFVVKLELLKNNENLKTEMGESGREFVVANYDSEILGNKLEGLYNSVIK